MDKNLNKEESLILLNKICFNKPFNKKNLLIDSSKYQFSIGSNESKLFSYNDILKKIYFSLVSESKSKEYIYTLELEEKKLEYDKLIDNLFKGYIIKNTDCIASFGSYADGSWKKGSSDLDILVIGSEDNLISFEKFEKFVNQIRRINIKILSIDPIQHHGVFIGFVNIPWPESIIPYESFKDLRFHKLGISKISLTKINKHQTSLENFNYLKSHLHFDLQKKYNFLNQYKIKVIYSSILMLIIYKNELQYGLYKTKKNHLNHIREFGSQIEKEVILRCTNYRNSLNYFSFIIFFSHIFKNKPVLYQILLIFESFFKVQSYLNFNKSMRDRELFLKFITNYEVN